MQENLKEILSHLSTDVDQQALLLYLQGKLTAEEQHHLEKKILDNEFAGDAVEGLEKIKDRQRLQVIVDQLNNDLRKKTKKKINYHRKLQLQQPPWTLISILLILLLVIIGYFVIHYYINNHR